MFGDYKVQSTSPQGGKTLRPTTYPGESGEPAAAVHILIRPQGFPVPARHLLERLLMPAADPFFLIDLTTDEGADPLVVLRACSISRWQYSELSESGDLTRTK